MARWVSCMGLVMAAAVAEAAEPTVHLLTMGQAPQAHVEPGDATAAPSLALLLETRVSMRVGDMVVPPIQLPAVKMSVRWHAGEVTIESAELLPGGEAQVAERLRAALGELVAREATPDSPAVAPTKSPATARTVAALRVVLDQLSVPLPTEPVGVSAQWEAVRTTDRAGVRNVERAVYELLEWDGKTLRVKVALDVGANPQAVTDGVRLTTLDGAGHGEIVLRLDSPGPVAGYLELAETLQATDGDQKLELTTETRVELSSL